MSRSTPSRQTFLVIGGAAGVVVLVTLFYTPVFWLLPEADAWRRWGVWVLGWTAAFAVLLFLDWYKRI